MSGLRPEDYIALKFDVVTTKLDGTVTTTPFPGGMEGEALAVKAWLALTKDPHTAKTKIIVTGEAIYQRWPPHVEP